MGRGAEDLDSGHEGLITRGAVAGSGIYSVVRQNIESEYGGRRTVGETIPFPNNKVLVLEEDDPSILMHGLSGVESVEEKEEGIFLVQFSSGEKALVDLENSAVKLMFADHDPERVSAALHAALASSYGLFSDLDPEVEEKFNAMMSAKARYADDPSPDNFRAYSKALYELGDDLLADTIEIDPDTLSFDREDQGELPYDKAYQQAVASQLYTDVMNALRSSDPLRNYNAVMFGADAEGESYDIPAAKLKEREEAAKRLNLEIPPIRCLPTEPLLDDNGKPMKDKDGNIIMDENSALYIMGAQESKEMNNVTMLVSTGSRFFTHRGPPGCGKDTFWKEFAAQTGRPYELISFGPDAKLEEAIGGSDFETVTFKEERLVPVLDKDGFEVTDENGRRKMETKVFEVAGGQMLTEKLGRLGDLMKEPTMIVLTEPEGSFGEGLVRINKALGDDVGEPTGRTFYVNSTEGVTHEVHPDCVITVTHNMDNTDKDEQRFRGSTHDRAGENIEWGPRPPEEDAKILAGMARFLTRKYSLENGRGEGMPALFPGMKDVTPTAEDLMPIVQLMELIRNDVEVNDGAGDFVEPMEMRRAIRFWDKYRMNAYVHGVKHAEAEAKNSLLQLMHGLDKTHEQRKVDTDAFLRTTLQALKPQGAMYFKLAREHAKKIGHADINIASGL